VRVGIQPFQADFRGFLFNDQQLGVRLFGNRDNNRFQYNLAAFWRLEKDTNSGLNAVLQRPRDDWLFVANAYRQDFLIPALTSQVTVVYNMNREAEELHVDDNGFPVRPALLGTLRGREYDVVYLGYNADGRIGRINLTASATAALGEDRNSFFTDRPADIGAFFGAAELSYDRDWMRFRLSGAYASRRRRPVRRQGRRVRRGVREPGLRRRRHQLLDPSVDPVCRRRAGGFAQRPQRDPELAALVEGGGAVELQQPGADAGRRRRRLRPDPRVPAFGQTPTTCGSRTPRTLQALRVEGSIPKDNGWDLSAAAIWRPKATQNLVFRLSGRRSSPAAASATCSPRPAATRSTIPCSPMRS
jgi:hypothetical protein